MVVERLKGELMIDNTSAIIKGCLGFYLNILINSDEQLEGALEHIQNTPADYNGGKHSVRLSPSLYLKIEGMAKLSKQSVKSFIEDVVAMILAPIEEGVLPTQLTNEIQIAA